MPSVRVQALFIQSDVPAPPQARKLPALTRSRLSDRAFTLVELLVSMTVSLLLIVILLRVFSAATTSWQRGEAQADAYREARGALQIMARDISTTIQPSFVGLSGVAPTAPALPTLALTRYPGGGGKAFNEEAYCLSNIINNPAPPSNISKDQGMSSELCAVGFFCQWMPTMAINDAAKARAPHAFALMRQFLNSQTVSKRLQLSVGTTSPLKFLDLYPRDSVEPDKVVPATPPAATSTQLAAYIWDLKFRIDTTLIATEDGEATPSGNGQLGGAATATPYDHSSPQPRVYDATTTPYPVVLPSYVEIRFKALSTAAGRRLEGNANIGEDDWKPLAEGASPSTAYKQIILPSARQFVLRVPLLSSNPPPPTPSPTP